MQAAWERDDVALSFVALTVRFWSPSRRSSRHWLSDATGTRDNPWTYTAPSLFSRTERSELDGSSRSCSISQ